MKLIQKVKEEYAFIIDIEDLIPGTKAGFLLSMMTGKKALCKCFDRRKQIA